MYSNYRDHKKCTILVVSATVVINGRRISSMCCRGKALCWSDLTGPASVYFSNCCLHSCPKHTTKDRFACKTQHAAVTNPWCRKVSVGPQQASGTRGSSCTERSISLGEGCRACRMRHSWQCTAERARTSTSIWDQPIFLRCCDVLLHHNSDRCGGCLKMILRSTLSSLTTDRSIPT